MKIITFIFFLVCSKTFCQDILTKSNGENIQVKIELINNSEIKYKMFNNLNGPTYVVDKSELNQIKLENGEIQHLKKTDINKKASKEETKEFIITQINEHGFEKDSFGRKYKASFEGDYLRLIVLRRNGNESNGDLYDFSNFFKFGKLDKRSDKLAYINIYVTISENKKNTKWGKHKLILRLDSYKVAESLYNALKHYNSFFVKEIASPKF